MVDAKRLVSAVDPLGALGDFGSTRRTLIRCAVVAGASAMLPAARAQDSDASAARPRAGDEFVFADPAREGQRVTLAEIAESSGSPILDQEALATMKRASPWPAPPSEVPDRYLESSVRIDFTLK